MATAVAVMDRPEFGANTDVLVVADPEDRTLTWVPRDLWCARIGDRVNRAYAKGGHERLAEALAEHGFALAHSLCLLPAAIETAIAGVEIAMPVAERMEFWYPLERMVSIREGRKRIVFQPLVERLSGERIHQWIGARTRADGTHSGDLERIARQQQLIAVLLGDGFDFRRALGEPSAVRISDPQALEELRAVRPDWTITRVKHLLNARVAGKSVLIRTRP